MQPAVGGQVRSLRLPEEVLIGLFLGEEDGPEGEGGNGFLSALFRAWVEADAVESASIFLRSSRGWNLLHSAPDVNLEVREDHQEIKRLLSDPECLDDVCGTEGERLPRRDGCFYAYTLIKNDVEYGRLVVQVDGPFETRIPLAIHRALVHHIHAVARRQELAPVRADIRKELTTDPELRLLRREWVRLFPEIVGQSSSMARVLDTLRRAAPQDVTIMLQGESGVGKELFARAIHRLSRRNTEPFVSENCAALPDSLFEAEVFGSEKGAYTGSDRTRTGLVERACGGTLFLDEIAELGLSTQSKLLRVLQEREVRRVGSSQTMSVDFRLVTATLCNLEEEVRQRRFREDLFFRIQVVSLWIPPLRERREDIPLLAEEFAGKVARARRIAVPFISDRAMEVLTNYDWPGNVRELRNEIEYAVTLSPEEITRESLSGRFDRTLHSYNLPRRVREELGTDLTGLERMVLGGVIRDVLQETGGNRTQAARVLGIPKANLYRRMRRYGLR